MTQSSSPAFSLEFFPPRDIAAQERLVRAAKQMLAIQPRYVSVTFGAGGSTRAGTAETVRTLANMGCDAAPHLSCIGASRDQLRDILAQYREAGVRRVVALRGDLPSGMGRCRRIAPCGRTGAFHPRGNRRLVPHRSGRLSRNAPAGHQPDG